eukprot:232614-Rhodomonas_salina.1
MTNSRYKKKKDKKNKGGCNNKEKQKKRRKKKRKRQRGRGIRELVVHEAHEVVHTKLVARYPTSVPDIA